MSSIPRTLNRNTVHTLSAAEERLPVAIEVRATPAKQLSRVQMQRSVSGVSDSSKTSRHTDKRDEPSDADKNIQSVSAANDRCQRDNKRLRENYKVISGSLYASAALNLVSAGIIAAPVVADSVRRRRARAQARRAA